MKLVQRVWPNNHHIAQLFEQPYVQLRTQRRDQLDDQLFDQLADQLFDPLYARLTAPTAPAAIQPNNQLYRLLKGRLTGPLWGTA